MLRHGAFRTPTKTAHDASEPDPARRPVTVAGGIHRWDLVCLASSLICGDEDGGVPEEQPGVEPLPTPGGRRPVDPS